MYSKFKKLALRKETLRRIDLSARSLQAAVQGGNMKPPPPPPPTQDQQPDCVGKNLTSNASYAENEACWRG